MDGKKLKESVAKCLDELVEHLLQDNVNSIHIKNIRNTLLSIKQSLADGVGSPSEIPTPVLWTANTRTSTQAFGSDSNKEAALTIAFAMSKFDYVLFNNLYSLSLNQGEVFEMAAALVGIKPTTLRNYRDTFDSHVTAVRGKQRQGWKKPLTQEFQEILEHNNSLDEEGMMTVVAETLRAVHPDVELIVKVAYGFLFATRGAKTTSELSIAGRAFEVINAPYPKGIAYLVLAGFGNTLFKGVYPAVYVYRDFGKVFTVFGESVTHIPDRGWKLPLDKYPLIEDCFTSEALEEIKAYPNAYLSNHVSREFVLDQNAVAYGEYKIELAKEIVDDLKKLISLYTEAFRTTIQEDIPAVQVENAQ